MIKRLARTILGKLGYEVHRKPGPDSFVGFNPSYLARICQPKTVFDVGIGYGTYPLYEAFPNAKFVLVEPLPVCEDYDFLLRLGATSRIQCLPAVTAESRSFTGTPGVQNHALEEQFARRCRAGIFWVHRKLLTPERFEAHGELLRSKGLTGRHLIKSWTEWYLRGRMIKDLPGWWFYHAWPYRKGRKTLSSH